MKKVLFTTPIIGFPPAGGPELRIFNTLKAMSELTQVTVYIRKATSEEERTTIRDGLMEVGISSVQFSPIRRSKLRITRLISRFYEFLIESLFRGNTQDFRAIKDLIVLDNFDVIWLGYGNISYPLLRKLRNQLPAARIVCDTDSVWSRFILRGLPYVSWYKRPTTVVRGMVKIREERKMVRMASLTTAVSAIDAEYYRNISSAPQDIMVLSNVIDLENYSTDIVSEIIVEPLSICLAGTFGHPSSPMDTATSWFLSEVWPIVINNFPDAHLYLVGKNSDSMWSHAESDFIHTTGKVLSVAPYLSGCAAIVVPLKFESGTRFKILEGGAYRKPIVSTTLGAEGLDMKNGRHILIADTAYDFASCIISIFDGTAPTEIGENCHEMVRLNYSLPTLQSQVISILGALQSSTIKS